MQLAQIYLINHTIIKLTLPNQKLDIKAYYRQCLNNNELLQIGVEDGEDIYINPNNILYITVKKD